MNRNNFWKLVLTILIVVWSAYEMYPPTNRSLVKTFKERAINRDAEFKEIVKQVDTLQKQRPDREYGNLMDAIGSRDVARYFPFFKAAQESNPKTAVLNRLQREAAGRIRLGLDLRGGTSFLVEMDTNRLAQASEAGSALSQAVEVLRKRVDKFGVAEPVIQPQGDDRILVQLPGLSQAEKESAMRTIQKAAFLEFRLASPTSEQDIKDGIIPPGHEVLRRRDVTQDGKEIIEEVVVRKRPEMDGSGLKSAMVVRGNLGEPQINFTLESGAAKQFGEITRNNVGQRLAIILDGELYSAPVIQSPIETGNGQITGRFDTKEAFELANVLENPLRAPLKIIESREVDPTLGKDSITSGIKAAIIATVLVSVFMLLYYLVGGIVANIALLLNFVILVGLMCSIGTTLTMPGIAGIVLSIGMAVDANVLIFERIREELAAGKSMRGAVSAGYDKAFGTIFDSNLTTLISAVLLIVMGTGPVKGFGVTLTIGIGASMFTALIVTRLMFDWLVSKGLLKNLKMLQWVKATKIDFLKYAVPAFALSWLIVLVGIAYGLYRGNDVLGVEFSGGSTITLNFNQKNKADVDEVRAAAAKAQVGDVMIMYQRDISTSKENLRVTTRGAVGEPGVQDASDKVIAQLKQGFPNANFEVVAVDRVGPTVGTEIRNTAILAGFLALFGILVYVAFRYEFSFAIGAVVAIIHDVFITLGVYFLFGRELNATSMAAILTIIGFSINDTIVIFDRIREDLRLGVRGSFKDVINIAVNQTLSRTIITSGTVLLATLALFIFGGGVINDFAFTFLIGILVGTYSTVYIASFIVWKWHKGERPQIGAPQTSLGTAQPANP